MGERSGQLTEGEPHSDVIEMTSSYLHPVGGVAPQVPDDCILQTRWR